MKKQIYLNQQDYELITDVLRWYIMNNNKWEKAHEVKIKIQEQWLQKQ